MLPTPSPDNRGRTRLTTIRSLIVTAVVATLLILVSGTASAVGPAGPPSAPTISDVTPGDGSATVAFGLPASNGGSPILTYTVTATDITSPGNGGQHATRSVSPITVPGLTNGDTYFFSVTATTSNGTGVPAQSPPVVVGPAPSPARVDATAGSAQKAQFGETFAVPLVATVLDHNLTPVPKAVVTFAVSSGPASFAGGSRIVVVNAGDDGVATAPALIAGPTAGQVLVTATSNGHVASYLETVTPVNADLVVFLTTPARTNAGAAFVARIVVLNEGTTPSAKTTARLFAPSSILISDPAGGAIIPTSSGSSVAFVMPGLAVRGKATFLVTLTSAPGFLGTAHIGVVVHSSTTDLFPDGNSASTFINIT